MNKIPRDDYQVVFIHPTVLNKLAEIQEGKAQSKTVSENPKALTDSLEALASSAKPAVKANKLQETRSEQNLKIFKSVAQQLSKEYGISVEEAEEQLLSYSPTNSVDELIEMSEDEIKKLIANVLSKYISENYNNLPKYKLKDLDTNVEE